MLSFLKRQIKTKTGKYGLALVVGSVLNATVNDPDTAHTTLAIANQVLTPETGLLGLAAMFLRDRDARKDPVK